MNANKRDQLLEKIKAVPSLASPQAEVTLYGSRARGDSNANSDWDLLILLNLPALPFDVEVKLMDALYEIEVQTGEVISPLIYTKKDWNEKHTLTALFENIKNEGVRIT
jgi:predicted nucleotidyltransferase